MVSIFFRFVRELKCDESRQLFRFIATDGAHEPICAVSFSALDDADWFFDDNEIRDRSAQFDRHRVRILEAIRRNYFASRFEASHDPRILVSAEDLRSIPF